MSETKVLVKYDACYADEFDITGFRVAFFVLICVGFVYLVASEEMHLKSMSCSEQAKVLPVHRLTAACVKELGLIVPYDPRQ